MPPLPKRALFCLLVVSCGEYRDASEEMSDKDRRVQDLMGGSLLSSPSEEKLIRDRVLALTLARTLEQLEGVERARVHLNLADKSLASRDRDGKSKAAVLIVHGKGARPDEEKLGRLTVAAVPGLDKEHVALFFTPAEKQPIQTVFVGPIEVAKRSHTKAKLILGGLIGLCLLMAVGLIMAGYRLRKIRKSERS